MPMNLENNLSWVNNVQLIIGHLALDGVQHTAVEATIICHPSIQKEGKIDGWTLAICNLDGPLAFSSWQLLTVDMKWL